MKKVMKKTYSGAVCEIETYHVGDRTDVKTSKPPRPRFRDEQERKKHRLEMARKRHERIFNATFGPEPDALYCTLTFDRENECHDFVDARILRDRFFRRLKYSHPDSHIFMYMGRGKTTNRIHFHLVCDGIGADEIRQQWTYGSIVDASPLRDHCLYDGVDHGRDFRGLANYLFNHWTDEIGGHYYKSTRNAVTPDEETPAEIKRTYDEEHPPRTPKGYIYIGGESTVFGYYRFRFVKDPGRLEFASEKRKRRCGGA